MRRNEGDTSKRRRTSAWILGLAAGLATGMLTGCAVGPAAPAPARAADEPPPLPILTSAQLRGQAFAMRRCGGCHNVGPDDGPPYEGPAFRKLADRYNRTSMEQRFADVSAHGFDSMPPISFSDGEADDLLAYLESLREP